MHIYVHRCSHFRRCLPTCCFACKTSLRLLLPSNWWCVCAERAREGADQGRESKRAQERARESERASEIVCEKASECVRVPGQCNVFLPWSLTYAFRFVRFGSCVFGLQVVDDGSIYSAASATAGCCTYSCVYIHFLLYPHAHIMLHICAYVHTHSLSLPPSLSLSLSLSLSHTHRERERERGTYLR